MEGVSPIPRIKNILDIYSILTIVQYTLLIHSHKKRKDGLEGSLMRVLFAAELEFPKILVPRLPQNTPNVTIEKYWKIKTTVLFM